MITEAELILTPSASALEIRMLGSLEVMPTVSASWIIA